MHATRMTVRCAAVLLTSTLGVAAQPASNAGPARLQCAEARMQYADHVEGLFDLTYATLPGFRPLELDLLMYRSAQSRAA